MGHEVTKPVIGKRKMTLVPFDSSESTLDERQEHHSQNTKVTLWKKKKKKTGEQLPELMTSRHLRLRAEKKRKTISDLHLNKDKKVSMQSPQRVCPTLGETRPVTWDTENNEGGCKEKESEASCAGPRRPAAFWEHVLHWYVILL